MNLSELDGVELNGLSAAERLLLAQDLWDSVISDLDAFPMTAEERRWIDARVAHADDPLSEFHSWPQVAAFARRDRSA